MAAIPSIVSRHSNQQGVLTCAHPLESTQRSSEKPNPSNLGPRAVLPKRTARKELAFRGRSAVIAGCEHSEGARAWQSWLQAPSGSMRHGGLHVWTFQLSSNANWTSYQQRFITAGLLCPIRTPVQHLQLHAKRIVKCDEQLERAVFP
eukprot:4464292-Amphidinium_carterae.2